MEIKVNKSDKYIVSSIHHFKEKEMTLKAKGLLSLMLSLPKDWDYSVEGLVKLSKDGRNSVINTLQELEDFGYLTRTRTRDETGKLRGTCYCVFEYPQPKFKNPTLDKPTLENQTQYILMNNNYSKDININNSNYSYESNNNDSNKKEINNKDIIKEKETKHKHGEFGRVLLTDKEYSRLCEEFGLECINNQIKLLDEYLESNNNKNKYTNFNVVLRKSIKNNWFVKNNTKNTNNSVFNKLQNYNEKCDF